jgi:ABC-type nitrate/sulfonate/bicarbonate transport system substrate-binding protein
LKRFASILATGMLLAGCGGSAAPASTVSSAAPATKPVAASAAAAPASAVSSSVAKPAAASSSAAASAKPAASGSAAASAKPAASGSAATAASAAGKLEQLKTAYGGAVILQIPLWSAIDSGIFKKYGFDPATPILASGRTALDQLIAGQADLIGAGPYAASLSVGAGAKIRMIGVFSNKEPFDIYTDKSITSPQQLVGQKVGTSGPASESATAFTLYLKKAGVDPSKVVFITQSTTSDQQTALLSGATVAGAITPPLLQPELAAKLHVLDDLSKSGIAWNPNGFHVSQAMVDSQPEKAVRILEALEEGGAYAHNNPDFTKGLIKKYMQMDASYLDEAYTNYKGLQAKNLAPSQEALDTVMGQALESQKDLTKDKIQPFYSSKILDQLKASGFLDKNGAPGS